MIFTALAISKILAFSQPQKIDVFYTQPRVTVENLRKLPGDGAGEAFLGFLPGMIPMPIAALGFINSIQSGTITIAAAATTGTYTLPTAVDWVSASNGRASLHFQGFRATPAVNTDARYHVCGIEITAANTVTATRNGTVETVTVAFTVIDWDSSFMKVVQFGQAQITTTATTGNAPALTAVVTANSAVQWNGITSTILGSQGSALTALTLTSTTNVQSSRHTGTSATITTYFCVMEFQASVLNSSTIESSPSWASSTTGADSSPFAAVTLAQCWTVYGGSRAAATGWNAQTTPYVFLKDTTHTRLVTRAAVSAAKATVTIVEFKATELAAAQRGQADELIDAVNAYDDISITAIPSTSKALVNLMSFSGTQTTGSGNDANLNQLTLILQSTTAIRMQRTSISNTIGITPSWEVLPFLF